MQLSACICMFCPGTLPHTAIVPSVLQAVLQAAIVHKCHSAIVSLPSGSHSDWDPGRGPARRLVREGSCGDLQVTAVYTTVSCSVQLYCTLQVTVVYTTADLGLGLRLQPCLQEHLRQDVADLRQGFPRPGVHRTGACPQDRRRTLHLLSRGERNRPIKNIKPK